MRRLVLCRLLGRHDFVEVDCPPAGSGTLVEANDERCSRCDVSRYVGGYWG